MTVVEFSLISLYYTTQSTRTFYDKMKLCISYIINTCNEFFSRMWMCSDLIIGSVHLQLNTTIVILCYSMQSLLMM